MRITAISGWAIPAVWFSQQIEKHFINSEINVIYPENPFDPEEAKTKLHKVPADLYLGYSLGSLWMFKHKDLFPKSSVKAVIAKYGPVCSTVSSINIDALGLKADPVLFFTASNNASCSVLIAIILLFNYLILKRI